MIQVALRDCHPGRQFNVLYQLNEENTVVSKR
jgi:hypothetical protein